MIDPEVWENMEIFRQQICTAFGVPAHYLEDNKMIDGDSLERLEGERGEPPAIPQSPDKVKQALFVMSIDGDAGDKILAAEANLLYEDMLLDRAEAINELNNLRALVEENFPEFLEANRKYPALEDNEDE